jgi:hypothetical protein
MYEIHQLPARIFENKGLQFKAFPTLLYEYLPKPNTPHLGSRVRPVASNLFLLVIFWEARRWGGNQRDIGMKANLVNIR